ncbi:multiheme c-type cytochrome [uncultured Gimesia sp.]|uniref:multiheme c-type cytochrome n=1 Tax=uncultured Gimesia sp. TaxID=1678688 RepID=UPI0026285737|nr:multiheme c-type cytochrome [uncultured Gimesia sp.]
MDSSPHGIQIKTWRCLIFAVALFAMIIPNIAFQDAQAENKGFVKLSGKKTSAESVSTTKLDEVQQYVVDQAHAECYVDDPFPSAAKCGKCHPQHYREWSVSPHAYAQLSPVFNAMSNKLIKLNNGTLGDFCIRCHTPVGMALSEPINMSNLDRSPTSREGVTCVSCHRINQAWGKGAGRQALVSGDLNQVVYGPVGDENLAAVLSNPDKYGVLKTDDDPTIRGRAVHARADRFFQLTTSGFCGTCHDVFAPNGFRLEDAFSEFKHSPSAKKCKENCQDCHMGAVPGQALGYDFSPAAVIGNVSTPVRKHTNHMIVGPDYSIVHRGIFPHNPKAVREEDSEPAPDQGLATMREWLCFDDAAGWGTPGFEKLVTKEAYFPAPWDDQRKRIKARHILNDQYELLGEAATQRLQILRAGYHLGEIQVEKAKWYDMQFSVPVSNITLGHGVPTGFDAERVVFLRTMVWDQSGRLVFQSGDLDPNGDIRDSHSLYVHNGEVPLDRQLFTLQSRFLTRNIRGGEREQVLNVPYSLDPLPYFRPATRPFTVLGRPIGARKQKQNIEAKGKRWAKYRLSRKQLTGPGNYTVRVQLIAGMVPVNLVHEISDVGFDYGMSARDVADGVVDGHMVLYEKVDSICIP